MVPFNVSTDQFQREVAVAKTSLVALTSAVCHGFDLIVDCVDIFGIWCVRVSASMYYLSTIKADIPFMLIHRCLQDK